MLGVRGTMQSLVLKEGRDSVLMMIYSSHPLMGITLMAMALETWAFLFAFTFPG